MEKGKEDIITHSGSYDSLKDPANISPTPRDSDSDRGRDSLLRLSKVDSLIRHPSSISDSNSSILFQETKENLADAITLERKVKREKTPSIPFPPCREWIPRLKTDFKEIIYSFLGAVIVGFTNIPIAIAYCIMIDVPLSYGVYSLVLPPIIYAFFGSSRQLSVGPESNAFIMIGQSIAAMNLPKEDRSGYLLTMTLIIGFVMITFGVSGIGFIENMVSQSIMGGFKVASAIIVFVEILIKMCNIPKTFSGKIYTKL